MIFVIRLLGEEQYGLYALALVPVSMIAFFRDWGIPSALTKYVAWFKTREQIQEIKKFVTIAFLFSVSISIALTITTFVLAKPIAMFYRKLEVFPLIKIASLALIAGAIYSICWGVFLGFEDTKYNAIMLIIYAVIKGCLSLILVFLGYGVFGAIIGYVFGFLASAVFGVILLPKELSKYKEGKKIKTNSLNQELSWKHALKILLGFGLPLAIANIIIGFRNQFYNLLAGRHCSKWDFGNYSAAATLLSPLPVLTLPIMNALFPAYSKIDGVKNKKLLGTIFKMAIKYVSLIIVPLTALIIGLSEPLRILIYGNRFPDASLYLMLLAIVYLYTVIGYLNFGPLLKGQGRTRAVMIGNAIGLAIGIPTSFLLIPLFGIIGLIFTNILTISMIMVFYIVFIKKHFKIDLDWKCSIKILLAGISAGLTAYFLQIHLNSYPIVELIVGGLVGLGVYILIILITRTLTMKDIRNLKVILGSIRPLRHILKPHAKKIEEILKKIVE